MFDLSDKVLMTFIGLLFFLAQFLYQIWAKSQTEKIIKIHNENTERILLAISSAIKSFSPHIDRGELTHNWVYQIKESYKVQENGIPLIYRNTRTETILEELTKITHMLATTQKALAEGQKELIKNIHEEHRDVMFSIKEVVDKLNEHTENCKEQHNKLEKELVKRS